MSAAPAKTTDPSMEEILASIRRIIADDDDRPADPKVAEVAAETARAAAPTVIAEQEDDDVLDLSTSDLTADPETSLDIDLPELSFRAAPEPGVASVTEDVAAPEPIPVLLPNPLMDEPAPRAPEPEKPRLADTPPPAPMPEPAVAPRTVADTIVSHATTASVGQAFNLLSHTIMSQNATTLEDIVREMLRPMLKTWLDDNLPPLVERLVTAEIQRVARGQR